MNLRELLIGSGLSDLLGGGPKDKREGETEAEYQLRLKRNEQSRLAKAKARANQTAAGESPPPPEPQSQLRAAQRKEGETEAEYIRRQKLNEQSRRAKAKARGQVVENVVPAPASVPPAVSHPFFAVAPKEVPKEAPKKDDKLARQLEKIAKEYKELIDDGSAFAPVDVLEVDGNAYVVYGDGRVFTAKNEPAGHLGMNQWAAIGRGNQWKDFVVASYGPSSSSPTVAPGEIKHIFQGGVVPSSLDWSTYIPEDGPKKSKVDRLADFRAYFVALKEYQERLDTARKEREEAQAKTNELQRKEERKEEEEEEIDYEGEKQPPWMVRILEREKEERRKRVEWEEYLQEQREKEGDKPQRKKKDTPRNQFFIEKGFYPTGSQLKTWALAKGIDLE